MWKVVLAVVVAFLALALVGAIIDGLVWLLGIAIVVLLVAWLVAVVTRNRRT